MAPSLFLACSVWAGEFSPTVVAPCDGQHYRHSEGTAVELPDGRLLLVWSRFDGHKDRCGTLGDNGPATLVAAESRDGGATWSVPRELPVGTATLNIMQAAFVPVRDRLMLAFSVRTKQGRTSHKYAIESTDNGRTWSPRRLLFEAGGANDRAVRLSTGRILMPSHKREGRAHTVEVLVARSDDEGITWSLSENLPHAPHPMELRGTDPEPLLINEPTVVERNDKSVLLFARSNAGMLYRSESTDGGVAWSRLEPTTIPAFAAPPYLRRLRDGRLLLLWNPITGPGEVKAREAVAAGNAVPLGPRRRLAMATSDDDGTSWSDPVPIAEDGRNGYCYPWLLQRQAGPDLVFCSRTPFTIYPCDLVQFPLPLASAKESSPNEGR